MAAPYRASHLAHGLRLSQAGGPLSSLGQMAEAACCPRPLWPSQPKPARRAWHALWAVTAPRADAVARLVAAHRWPWWEEVAGTNKRGPWSMHRMRRGVLGLTKGARAP
jgi:hypothetical protein